MEDKNGRKLQEITISYGRQKNKHGSVNTDVRNNSARLLGKDQDVSTEVLTKVCAALGCEVQDIVDFLPEEKPESVKLNLQ